MKFRNREYILTWLALIIVIVTVTLLVILSLRNYAEPIILFLLWGLTAVASVYLFTGASRQGISMTTGRIESTAAGKASAGEGQPDRKKDSNLLDIQSVANKIVRRVTPGPDPEQWGKQLLDQIVDELEIMSAVFYYRNTDDIFIARATFAYPHAEEPFRFLEGEGLPGQVARSRLPVFYRTIPDNYNEVFSGLGSAQPAYLAILPLVVSDKTIAVMEFAGFRFASENLEQLFQILSRDLSQKFMQQADQEQEEGPSSSKRKSRTAGEKK